MPSDDVQDCEIAGLFVVVPQLFASVQVRVCVLSVQADHAPQDQLSVHDPPLVVMRAYFTTLVGAVQMSGK